MEVQNAISIDNSVGLRDLQNNEIIIPEPIIKDENFVLLQQGNKMPGMENLAFIEVDQDGFHFFGQSGTSAHWITIHNNDTFSDIVLDPLPTGSYNSITIGDVDGDGYLDAVLGMSYTNQYLVVLLDASTKTTKQQYLSLARGQFPNGAQILDIDHDGMNEIIFQHGDGAPQIAVYQFDPITDMFVDIATISEGFYTNSPQP